MLFKKRTILPLFNAAAPVKKKWIKPNLSSPYYKTYKKK